MPNIPLEKYMASPWLPGSSGDAEMALSTISTKDEEIEIRDRIRQGQAGGMGMGGMGMGRRNRSEETQSG